MLFFISRNYGKTQTIFYAGKIADFSFTYEKVNKTDTLFKKCQ